VSAHSRAGLQKGQATRVSSVFAPLKLALASSMHEGCEAGIRPGRFWTWAVSREALTNAQSRRSAHGRGNRRGDPSKLANDMVAMAGRTRLTDPVEDHGVIYRCLHDNHRLAHGSRSTGSLAAVRLPPVQPSTVSASPYAGWHTRDGNEARDCVESAVTAVSGLTAAVNSDRGPRSVLSRMSADPCVEGGPDSTSTLGHGHQPLGSTQR
jgi:hypothetical protein